MELDYLEDIKIGMDDALIIVDIQYDFLEGGSLAVPDGNAIISGVNEIGRLFNENAKRVIFTQDWHTENHWSFASSHEGYSPFDPIKGIDGIGPVLWPDHCIQGKKGSEFHQDLDTDMAHLIIRKGFRTEIDSYSAIQENDKETETGLAGYLKNAGVNRVFVAGLAKDYCVNFTAQDARKKGFDVIVIDDLTRGIDQKTIAQAEEKLLDLGVNFTLSTHVSSA